MLSFVAIALDHTTAGVELRERVASADGEIPAAVATDDRAPWKGVMAHS